MSTHPKPGTLTSAHDVTASRTGRPPYPPEIADKVIERLAAGETLVAICRDTDMPSTTTVQRWRDENPSFRAAFAQARHDQMDVWGDECVAIADDGTTDYITKVGRNGVEYEAVDQEHIQRSRLRVDTRLRLMAVIAPHAYGPKVEHDHTGVVAVQHELSDKERARRMALFLTENRGMTIEGELADVEPRSLHGNLPPVASDGESEDNIEA